jgi:hypothetical protein
MDFGKHSDFTNDFSKKDWGDLDHLTFKDLLNKVKDDIQLGFKREIFDGQDVLVGGEPDAFSDLNHLQGDNTLGFNGTCGLVSCEDVLKQHGIAVTENDVVWHAFENGECSVDINPDFAGGTTPFDQAEILRDYGVEAGVVVCEDVADLASMIESDRSVIVGVNAGVLWGDPRYYGTGGPNHAITPTGVVRDANDLSVIKGFYINDSGTGHSKEFIPVDKFEKMWLNNGASLAVATFDKHSNQ